MNTDINCIMFFRELILQRRLRVATPISGTSLETEMPRLFERTISDLAGKVPIYAESLVIVTRSEVEVILAYKLWESVNPRLLSVSFR